jgi:hypothetical protein
MTSAMDALPEWTGVKVTGLPAVGDGMPRRTFLRRLGGVGALTFALQALDLIGGGAPAGAGAPACGIEQLTYRGGCYGVNYASTCTNGCARSASVSNRTFCRYPRFNSRHRTCGEEQTLKDVAYEYAVRKNECFDGVSDGWLWWSSGRCGCANRRKFSCNDGYYRTAGSGPWSKSICRRRVCA